MSRSRCFRTLWFAAGFAVFAVHGLARAAEPHGPNEQEPTYMVKPGDALSLIAERYRVSLALLRKVNSMSTDTIRSGQVLLLPSTYEVKPGDVLGTIAERHGVKLSELLRYNDLGEQSVLKVGQKLLIAGGAGVQGASKVALSTKSFGAASSTGEYAAEPLAKSEQKAAKPEYYEHEVRPNEVLSLIAERYALSTGELHRINRLGKTSLIRVGQRLRIPVTSENAHLTRPKPWTKYARTNFERGKVTLTTMGGSWSGRVFDDKRQILPQARASIQSLLASWETGRKVQVALHPRLYELIVLVSDEFGGRPIRVVSGYRQSSYARHSKHRVGRALDFSVPGVPNTALVDFLLTVPNTGVGYYPNTTHVHMDARASSMYWVDTSGPGQAPRYVHKSNTGERAPSVTARPRATQPKGRTPKHQPRRRTDRAALLAAR